MDRASIARGAMDRRSFLERLLAAGGVAFVGTQALLADGLPPATWNAGARCSEIKFPAQGATLQGYLSRPIGTGPFRAVVMIPENGDLDERAREAAQRLAGAGYVALVVDLLSRQGGAASFATIEAARNAVGSLRDNQVRSDVGTALWYLRSHPAVKKDRIRVANLMRETKSLTASG